jgi:CheY-like chemotaxis protein
MKVLIVEDNPHMRDLLGVLVGHMGHVAILASQSQEALEKAKAEKPELIIMDIMMPGMDGRELTRVLRATPEPRTFLSRQRPQCFGRTIFKPALRLDATTTSLSHSRSKNCEGRSQR